MQRDNQINNSFTGNNQDDTNPVDETANTHQLPNDDDTPFSPPDGVQDRVDDTHPITDSKMDAHEHYDAGLEAATGADLSGQAADEGKPPEDLTIKE